MIDTFETYAVETSEVPTPTQPFYIERKASAHRLRDRARILRQVLRFGLVGGLNTLAALLMLTISLSWAVAVDLTPASQRPYVGSSQNNSEISLALGYNGIQRLLGAFGFGGRNAGSTSGNTTGSFSPAGPGGGTVTGDFPQPGAGGSGQPPQGLGSGGGGMFNTGNPGLLRLFNEPLGGQIVWLLPMALQGMLALAWQGRPRFRENSGVSRQQQSLILWGVWLLTMAVFFSVAGFFHQYYLSTFAPAINAHFILSPVSASSKPQFS